MGVEAAERGRRTVRKLIPLGLIFLASGLSTAVVGPFLALFLRTFHCSLNVQHSKAICPHPPLHFP